VCHAFFYADLRDLLIQLGKTRSLILFVLLSQKDFKPTTSQERLKRSTINLLVSIRLNMCSVPYTL
jgi:hypothetical protein